VKKRPETREGLAGGVADGGVREEGEPPGQERAFVLQKIVCECEGG
jgi:hypothetical protein